MSGFGSAISTAVSYIPTPFQINGAVEGVKAVNEQAGMFAGMLAEMFLADEEGDGLDNPHFTQNGHDGHSPRTVEYFNAKKGAMVGSTVLTGLTGLDTVAAGGQALSTSLAWYRINALFEKLVPPSRRAKGVVYANWYSYAVAKKAVPPGSLETRMTQIIRQKMYSAAGSATKFGAGFAGPVVGYFVNAGGKAWQAKLDAYFGQDVNTLAQGLHWFAFLETVVGRGQANGPAQRIIETLWLEFSLGKSSGVHWKEIVREPRGWLVIADLIK